VKKTSDVKKKILDSWSKLSTIICSKKKGRRHDLESRRRPHGKPRALLKLIDDEILRVLSAVGRSRKREVPVLRGAANLARGFRDCQSNLPRGGDSPHASEEEGRQEEHQEGEKG
jgi:hypothetical protein